MIHTMIATERRSLPRQLALAQNNDLVTPTGKTDANGMPIYTVTPRPPQLHSMGERLDNPADANILYAAEWDGRAPYLIVHKGAISDIKLAFAGWPMVDRATWEAEAARIAAEACVASEGA